MFKKRHAPLPPPSLSELMAKAGARPPPPNARPAGQDQPAPAEPQQRIG